MIVTIEGHADERGTTEYNLALGDRRANAVRNYLMALGIDQERILTISYGEERPADPGHDDTAWAPEPARRHHGRRPPAEAKTKGMRHATASVI